MHLQDRLGQLGRPHAQALQQLPQAQVTLFDARPLDRDVSTDARTLALSLGSVQLLQRLGVWPAELAQPILQVHVSQAPPTLRLWGADSAVQLSAEDERVPMLGAVLSHGQLVAALQRAWTAAVTRQPHGPPQRLVSRFGTPVSAVKPLADGVEIDAGVAERFDLAVIAEGGVFAEQARKALAHDYGQTAWVGTVEIEGGTPGLAVERFTRCGPLALLPLLPLPLPLPPLPPQEPPWPASPAQPQPLPADGPRPRQRAAMVWCVDSNDDPVAELSDAQRLAVLATQLPAPAGRVVSISTLKRFALGLNAERSLVDGCTVRIGNAAQTLHPVAGQGLNLGLRDAFELVQVLRRRDDQMRRDGVTGVRAQSPLGSLQAALRRVEWSRAPDRWAMIGATDFLARSFTWRWPGLPAVRGLGLAALQALPPLKSALARQMMFGRR